MNITETLYVKTRTAWRSWLKENHDQYDEIWFMFYKKHTEKPSVKYDEAVEEALCFGWIDSILKRLDNERYVQRFTPRKANSQWSDLNKKRAKKLIGEGKMTKSGMAVLSFDPNAEIFPPPGMTLPVSFEDRIKKNIIAWSNFSKMAPSYKKNYIRYIMEAKREETKLRRLKAVIEALVQNKKPGFL